MSDFRSTENPYQRDNEVAAAVTHTNNWTVQYRGSASLFHVTCDGQEIRIYCDGELSHQQTLPAIQDAADLRASLAKLYRLAVWAQETIPESIAEYYGDISSDLAEAERLLQVTEQSQQQ